MTTQRDRFISPWSDFINEIFCVHMHRYLMPLLVDHEIASLWVCVGFEASQMPALVMRVTANQCVADNLPVDYASLISENRRTDLEKVLSRDINGRKLLFKPILSISEPNREHIHAYAVSEKDYFSQEVFCVALRTRINEAVRAFRHNSLRIAFEDAENATPKDFLSLILDLLPAWCGADHSASIILSSGLESMVLSSTGNAKFHLIAEKLYIAPADPDKSYDKLTGLEFVVHQDASTSLLAHAFNEVRRSKKIGLNLFVNDGEKWFMLGEEEIEVHRFSTGGRRPVETMTALYPLLCDNELKQSELLGFISINFSRMTPLSSLTSRVLETLAKRIANYLRRSPFFSLSSQQLWLLECIRDIQVATSRLFRDNNVYEQKIQHFIADVNHLVATQTGIPLFAIGYKTTGVNDEEIARFVKPFGTTEFQNIDLPLYTDNVEQSSIATLAMRLNTTITLGEYNQNVYVNEDAGIIADARLSRHHIDENWRPLSAYHKSARSDSYATMSYPIRNRDEVIGVITVEVDRDTDWIWWEGFGSYLFYRLMSNELAADFALLRSDKVDFS